MKMGLLIRQGNADTKMIVEDLMNGESLLTEIDEEKPFGYTLMRKKAREGILTWKQAHFMNEITLVTFSSFDIATNVAKNDAPERFHSVEATTMSLTGSNSRVCFYHGFVLGLMVELADRYEITSNQERGFGRYDILLVPRKPEQLDPPLLGLAFEGKKVLIGQDG